MAVPRKKPQTLPVHPAPTWLPRRGARVPSTTALLLAGVLASSVPAFAQPSARFADLPGPAAPRAAPATPAGRSGDSAVPASGVPLLQSLGARHLARGSEFESRGDLAL